MENGDLVLYSEIAGSGILSRKSFTVTIFSAGKNEGAFGIADCSQETMPAACSRHTLPTVPTGLPTLGWASLKGATTAVCVWQSLTKFSTYFLSPIDWMLYIVLLHLILLVDLAILVSWGAVMGQCSSTNTYYLGIFTIHNSGLNVPSMVFSLVILFVGVLVIKLCCQGAVTRFCGSLAPCGVSQGPGLGLEDIQWLTWKLDKTRPRPPIIKTWPHI